MIVRPPVLAVPFVIIQGVCHDPFQESIKGMAGDGGGGVRANNPVGLQLFSEPVSFATIKED